MSNIKSVQPRLKSALSKLNCKQGAKNRGLWLNKKNWQNIDYQKILKILLLCCGKNVAEIKAEMAKNITLFVGSRAGFTGVDTSKFLQHPWFRSCQTFHVLLGSTNHNEAIIERVKIISEMQQKKIEELFSHMINQKSLYVLYWERYCL